jgi:hypothetical protein
LSLNKKTPLQPEGRKEIIPKTVSFLHFVLLLLTLSLVAKNCFFNYIMFCFLLVKNSFFFTFCSAAPYFIITCQNRFVLVPSLFTVIIRERFKKDPFAARRLQRDYPKNRFFFTFCSAAYLNIGS